MPDNAKTKFTKNRKFLLTGSAVILIIFLVWLGYYKGYRFENNFMIGKVGTVSMEIPFPQTNIFIDESEKIITSKENQTVIFSLSPRDHSVIVSRDGYFPWKKDFSMPSAGSITLSPIFISQNTSGVIITKIDPEYWKIRNQITSDKLPTKSKTRLGSDNLTEIWIDNNAIIAKVREKIYTVIQPETAVKNLDFFKDRTDSVVFSTGTGIYMIEISKLGTQNFIPIYKGQNPYFIRGESNYIYVLDGETLMQVVI